eukprot:c50730_g1_i1 orf=16-225(+)
MTKFSKPCPLGVLGEAKEFREGDYKGKNIAKWEEGRTMMKILTGAAYSRAQIYKAMGDAEQSDPDSEIL